MLKLLPFKFSVNAMLILLGSVMVFHTLILLQVIPFKIIWGGKLETIAQMRSFEIVSVIINVLMITVIALKGKYIKSNIPVIVINIILWLMVLLFTVNTVGNLLAESSTETIVFTPVAVLSAVLCFRIVKEK